MPSSDAAFGRKWLELLPAEVRADGQRALTRARTGKTARFAGKSVLPGRKPQYRDNILTPVLDGEGAVETILCVSRDVTAQRLAQHRLRVASEHDPLTDLLNRRSLKSRMMRAVTRGRQNGSRVGLLLIDLDHFMNVNDTLGHGAGDHLLRVLSRRLKARLPAAATVGRLGGDEFAVLLEDVESEEQMVKIAQQVLAQIAEPIRHSGRVINGGMSIGGALFPRDDFATKLLRRLDYHRIPPELIEIERQRDILLSAECRFGQGFLFGKAMSAADAARRLVELPATGWSPGGPPMQVGRGSLPAQAPVAGAGLSAPTPNG